MSRFKKSLELFGSFAAPTGWGYLNGGEKILLSTDVTSVTLLRLTLNQSLIEKRIFFIKFLFY